ncbi:hypothetical protein V8G54_023549 [Vigna mungo]|uniref:Uncharacterized protein n=1 Tax=Vigna mungo TaxID=3915 RepID=A0AAQ3N5M1_VIGMU
MDSIHSCMCMCIYLLFRLSSIIYYLLLTLVLYAHCIFWLPYEILVGLGSVVASPNKISYYQMLIILVGLFILFKIKALVLKANAVNTIRDVLANRVVKSCACF